MKTGGYPDWHCFCTQTDRAESIFSSVAEPNRKEQRNKTVSLKEDVNKTKIQTSWTTATSVNAHYETPRQMSRKKVQRREDEKFDPMLCIDSVHG